MSIVLWAVPAAAVATVLDLASWRRRRPTPSRLTHATLIAALDVYKTAWERQVAALILTLVTADAVSHEWVLQEPIGKHDGVAA